MALTEVAIELAALHQECAELVWHVQHFPAYGKQPERFECAICYDGYGYVEGTWLGEGPSEAEAIRAALTEKAKGKRKSER